MYQNKLTEAQEPKGIASLSHRGNNSGVFNDMLKGCVRDPKTSKCAGAIGFLCGVCLTRQNPDLGRETK